MRAADARHRAACATSPLDHRTAATARRAPGGSSPRPETGADAGAASIFCRQIRQRSTCADPRRQVPTPPVLRCSCCESGAEPIRNGREPFRRELAVVLITAAFACWLALYVCVVLGFSPWLPGDTVPGGRLGLCPPAGTPPSSPEGSAPILVLANSIGGPVEASHPHAVRTGDWLCQVVGRAG